MALAGWKPAAPAGGAGGAAKPPPPPPAAAAAAATLAAGTAVVRDSTRQEPKLGATKGNSSGPKRVYERGTEDAMFNSL